MSLKEPIMVQKAYNLCISAHAGQFRRDGVTPYSSHPIAVAHSMTTPDEKIVALLHDVLEDTVTTASDLNEAGFSVDIILAIIALTKINNENYSEYLKRVSENALATKVKIMDIYNNSTDSPTEKQLSKYAVAMKYLVGTL